MEEIEVKFLDIHVSDLEIKLIALGAQKQFDKLYRRRVYDYPDLRLNTDHSWVRIRDEGDKVTMGFKRRIVNLEGNQEKNDISMEEVEIEVSDFEKTALILEKIGLTLKFYQENRRIRYTFEGIEFDIDFWPQLNPYLEIEAHSWDEIDRAINLLSLNPADKKIFSTNQIYKINGIRSLDYIEMTFDRMVKRV